MPLSPLQEAVIAAYGGADYWRNSRAVEAVVSAGGFAFVSKLQPAFHRMKVHARTAEPRVWMRPHEWSGTTGILEGQAVRLEDGGGQVTEMRAEPRQLFPGGRRLVWWDRLDQTYFSGYALWNYLTFPALLLRDDIAWRQIGPASLEARFPAALPTHNAVQQFHFDPGTLLLRQHDYTAEVFGGWAKAANVVLEHGRWMEIPYPSKRRVTPRRSDGTPRGGPVLVAITIDDWKLV